ncbi:hypothetical protein [Roseibium sediminis]|uniref:hypothetical protein n=1 Tax=Roseibium sediminis TaxID=1775174 RepID=UPI00123D0D6C|nr:hypothetical protein [Roseibium sediminis]
MTPLITGADIVPGLADLLVDYWKLARGAVKAAGQLQEAESKRLLSQTKYAVRQLNGFADRCGFRIVEFEGLVFEPGIAASADNEDDFENETALIVTRTIEPAIICDMRVVRPGRVIVAQNNY